MIPRKRCGGDDPAPTRARRGGGSSRPSPREQGALLALVVLGLSGSMLAQLAARDADAPTGPDCRWPRSLRSERGFTRVVTCAAVPGGGKPIDGPARWLFGGRISLNAADARLLESLPGIGPARAQAIVAERRVRAFDAVEDLTRVHGIGPATTRELAPLLRVDPPTALVSRSAETDGED